MPLFAEAEFFRAVHDPADLPADTWFEIAFAGRSNAGKSSAINAILGRRRLAFVSKTPGRTQTLNFFRLGPGSFLVDLPGYGFAAVPHESRHHWAKLISTYIQNRTALHGLILIMDARRPFTPSDQQLLDWIAPLHKPSHALLTKADKLRRAEARDTFQKAQALAAGFRNCSVQLFSSTTGDGVERARAVIAGWLHNAERTRNKKPPVKGE